jgi:restriction system protein
MAIPDYQTLMLPFLEVLADGQTRRIVPQVTDALAARFGLTAAEREQHIASGPMPTLDNRTHWAATYLAKALLIERPTRGHARITDRGGATLAEKPSKINIAYLRRFPEFEEFRTRARQAAAGTPGAAPDDHAAENPEEHLYVTYDALRASVEAEILERLQSDDFQWAAFELLVVELLGAMGYGGSVDEARGRVTKKSGDDGIDGVIDQDRLGLDSVYIQAKKYAAKNGVGRPALQAFAGSLEGQRAAKGVFITTSYFTADADDYVRRISKRIILIDGRMLARLMYDYGLGVRSRRSLDVKRIDDAYFEGDA